jgi:hypothetical protein
LLALVAVAAALITLSPSCSNEIDDRMGEASFMQGLGTLPGVVGTQGGVGTGVQFLPQDLPTPLTDTGSTGGAPLGYNPQYNSQQGSADEELVHSASRSTSALLPGEVFKLKWVAMVPEGVTPVPNGPRYTFKEGDSVDLYADYEVAANVPFVRRWQIDTAGLDYTEDYKTHAVAGEYRVKLNYVLPVGSAAVNSSFIFEAYYGTSRTASRTASDKNSSVIITEPGPGFEIIDLTMVKDGEPVDWTLTTNQFYEGDSIDLWIKYEMLSNQITLDRHWDSADIDLQQWDYGVPTTKGVYEIKLDWVIPDGSAKEDAVFQYDLTGLGTTKYSNPFLFDILVPGTIVSKEPPDIINFPAGESVWCGKLCVMTAHATYPFNQGSVDGMVQNYDKRFSPVLDLFDWKTKHLLELTDLIKDPNQKFKIIVANADLSFGARISINKTYNQFDPTTYVKGTAYDDTALSALPTYSLSGVAGSTKLTKLQVSFSSNDEHHRMVVAAAPGGVKKNVPGPNGTYRNGAFTIQLVKVNADGTPAFTTTKALSAGGMHGAAVTGLLYETNVHYTWGGPGNKQSPWPNYNPGADKKCVEHDPLTGPRILARGTSMEQIGALIGVTTASFPSASNVYQMNWEDLLNAADADYNDFVGRMAATEHYLPSGNLKQVTLLIKASARGNKDDSDWQLNMNAAFPGGTAVATVNQYFDDEDGNLSNDATHEFDGLWSSVGGVAIPVFQNARLALPDPGTKTKTANVVAGSTYILGDYSLIRIVFKGDGVAPNSYTKAPYTPELRVEPTRGTVYVYNLWQQKGDPLFSNGLPRGGYIVPAAHPWALEGRAMSTVYSGWNAWVSWINPGRTGSAPATPWYTQPPTANHFQRALFN